MQQILILIVCKGATDLLPLCAESYFFLVLFVLLISDLEIKRTRYITFACAHSATAVESDLLAVHVFYKMESKLGIL